MGRGGRHSCPMIFLLSPQTSNLLLSLPQMKTSSSNTTEPSCCPWPIAGKTPTARSSLCEWHRAKSKKKSNSLHRLKCPAAFDCFCFFFCLLSLSLERNAVESDVKKNKQLQIHSFSPTHVTFFSLAVFCVKFTETLASCSAKVMCLQGCASLSSPDSVDQSLAYILASVLQAAVFDLLKYISPMTSNEQKETVGHTHLP